MSWNINVMGLRADVKAKVQAEQHLPPSLRTAIVEIIDDITPASHNGMRVVGYGHSGGGYSNIGKLEVTDLIIKPGTPSPTAPPPPGTQDSGSK